jgi:ABC-2 type transport system permease protein
MLNMLTAQLRYQATLIMRTPRAFIFGLVMPALLLAVETSHHKGSTTAVTATVAGLVVFGMLNISYLTYAAGLVVAREDGVLRRWHASPLPAWAYFAGRIIAVTLMADAAGLILLLAGVSMAGLHLTVTGAACLILATTLGSIAVAAAGTAIAPLLPPGQGAYSLLGLTYVPLLLFGGGLGSASVLPHWLTTALTYLPVQPIIAAATTALQPHGTTMPARDLLVLAAWTVGALALSARFFRWDPTRPAHARKPAGNPPAIQPTIQPVA